MKVHYCLFYKEDYKDSQVQLRYCENCEVAKQEAEQMIESFKYWGGGSVPVSVTANKWSCDGKYLGEASPRIDYGEERYIEYAREKGTKYGYYREKQRYENVLCSIK